MLEITTDETQLLKLTFSGTPDVSFPMQREVRDLPGQVVRRVWNEGLRDYETRTAPATPSDAGTPRHAHSEPTQQGVTPNNGGRVITKALRRNPASSSAMPMATRIYPVTSSNPPWFQQSPTMASKSPQSA